MRERRLIKVAVTKEILIKLFTQDNFFGAVKTTNGVPQDAAFVYSYTDDIKTEVYLVFEHPSFEAVQLGSEIPTLYVELMQYRGTKAVRLLLENEQGDE